MSATPVVLSSDDRQRAPAPPPAAPRPTPKKPPMLFEQSQAIVAQIEARLGGTFMAYWSGPNGSVCQGDVVGLYEMLRQIGRQECVHLSITSGGGNGRASLRMVNLLRGYSRRLVALIAHDCLSAATMLALGADEIRMGPLAQLSAVDTSLRHDLSPVDNSNSRVSVSQDELTRVINLWRQEKLAGERNPYEALYQYVHPLVIGAVDRASSLSQRLCEEILAYHMTDADRARRISRALNSEYPSHTYPIMLREARRIGLDAAPLDEQVNNLLLELSVVHAEMGQFAITDYDSENYHNNEVLNIIESRGVQVLYQVDKDYHYRSEERRWVPMNDESAWHKVVRKDGKIERSVFHIR